MIKECSQLIHYKLAYGTSQDLEEIKCNNLINKCKHEKFWRCYIKEHSRNWAQIPDHPYWILIIGSSGHW